jgi:hypothetical protein
LLLALEVMVIQNRIIIVVVQAHNFIMVVMAVEVVV